MNDYKEDENVFNTKFEKFIDLLKNSKRLGVLTGAGVSTLSNIPDFRGNGGIYTKKFGDLDVEQILDIDFFYKNPKIFYQWASNVWYKLEQYKPNIVHKMLALLEEKGIVEDIFTQNIDFLHQRAGSKKVFEVHGSSLHNYCTVCHKHFTYEQVSPIASKGEVPYCDSCGGVIKPDIVFYGESLNADILSRAEEVFSHQCDLCLVLGSSLNVGPINQMPVLALNNRAKLVIVNAQTTHLDKYSQIVFKDLFQFSSAMIEHFEK